MSEAAASSTAVVHTEELEGLIFHEIKHGDEVEYTIYESVDDVHAGNPFIKTQDRDLFIKYKLAARKDKLERETL